MAPDAVAPLGRFGRRGGIDGRSPRPCRLSSPLDRQRRRPWFHVKPCRGSGGTWSQASTRAKPPPTARGKASPPRLCLPAGVGLPQRPPRAPPEAPCSPAGPAGSSPPAEPGPRGAGRGRRRDARRDSTRLPRAGSAPPSGSPCRRDAGRARRSRAPHGRAQRRLQPSLPEVACCSHAVPPSLPTAPRTGLASKLPSQRLACTILP